MMQPMSSVGPTGNPRHCDAPSPPGRGLAGVLGGVTARSALALPPEGDEDEQLRVGGRQAEALRGADPDAQVVLLPAQQLALGRPPRQPHCLQLVRRWLPGPGGGPPQGGGGLLWCVCQG